MAHHRIIIETARVESGWFRSVVVEGPRWAKYDRDEGESAESAYGACRSMTRARRRATHPDDTFDFIHVHAQETT